MPTDRLQQFGRFTLIAEEATRQANRQHHTGGAIGGKGHRLAAAAGGIGLPFQQDIVGDRGCSAPEQHPNAHVGNAAERPVHGRLSLAAAYGGVAAAGVLRCHPGPDRYGDEAVIRFLLNLLWFLLGGVLMGLGWWLAGLLCAIAIVGLPWARSCFVIGSFSFWPFGQEAVSRRELSGHRDLGTGPLGLLGNVLWFLVAGWWLAIGHLSSALACFITIIGIPFGIQHIKLALIALAPVGMAVVPRQSRP